MADNKVVEVEIVNETGEVKMKDMPEQPTKWQRFKNFCKAHWKGAVIGVVSSAAAAGGAYAVGYKKGKASTNSISTDDTTGYLEEGQNDDYPEV